MATIGKILVEGLKVIDPTVKGIDLVQTLAEFVHNKNIEKIDKINKKLLEDEASEYEKEQILSGGIDKEDYLSFIRAAVNDDEDKKTIIYITFYRNILTNKVDKKKGHIFKMIKDLPYSALELLPIIYIHKNHHVQNKSLTSFLQDLEKNESLTYEVNLLKQYGLLMSVPMSKQKNSNDLNIHLPTYFNNIATLLFKEKELLPKSQKIKIYNKNTFIFIDLEDYTPLAYFQNMLSTYSIKLRGNLNILAIKEYKILLADSIICVLNNKKLDKKIIEIIKEYEKNYKIIKICLEKNVEDQLNEIKGDLTYIEKGNKTHEHLLLEKFNISTLNLF